MIISDGFPWRPLIRGSSRSVQVAGLGRQGEESDMKDALPCSARLKGGIAERFSAVRRGVDAD